MPPAGTTRAPTNLVCVVDVSGSMSSAADPPDGGRAALCTADFIGLENGHVVLKKAGLVRCEYLAEYEHSTTHLRTALSTMFLNVSYE